MLPKNKKLPKVGSDIRRDNVKKAPGKKHNPPKHDGKGGKKPDGKGGKKPSGGGGGKFFGGHGGYKGVKKKDVNRLVNGLMREEMNGLEKQARGIDRDAEIGLNRARTNYNRGVGDLNYVHGETGDYLQNLAQRSAAGTQQAMSQQQQAQAALQGMLGDTYSGAQQGASDELARLGIQGGGNLGQLQSDYLNSQAVGAQSSQNAQSTSQATGDNAAIAMQLLQGMNQGSMMQGIGQNLNKFNDQSQTLQDNRMGQMNEVRQAMQEANQTRKDLYFQLLQQLQQTGWDQFVQQRELGQQNRSLNMQQRENNRDFRLRKRALKKSK